MSKKKSVVLKMAMACLLYEVKPNLASFSFYPATLWNQFITVHINSFPVKSDRIC